MTGADLISGIKRQPIGFVCGAICLVSGLWLYYRGDEMGLRQESSDKIAAEVGKINDNIRNSDRLSEQAAAMLAASSDLEARLMRAGQLAVNQQYFYRLEGETGVKLADLRQGPISQGKASPTAGAYIGVPYNFSVQGTFPQVLAFLRRLETGRHFSHFKTVTFSKTGGPDGGGELLTITIAVDLLGLP